MKQALSKGSVNAVLAYLMWGGVPIYWKQIQHISSLTILAQRTFWATLFFFILVLAFERKIEFYKHLKDRRLLQKRFLCTIFLAVNWGLYIWAVNSGHILETSLGYFLNPILNILLGAFFLGEKLSKPQKVAFLLALTGSIILTIGLGRAPWIAISLAVTFGLYGFFRKGISEPVWVSSFYESLIMVGFVWLGVGLFGEAVLPIESNLHDWLFLVGSGVITGLPLLFFARATQLMKLSTLGFYQYISPTLQFLAGYLIYHETLTEFHWMAFSLVWIALGVVSLAAIWNLKVRE